jgi:hypothetical protein
MKTQGPGRARQIGFDMQCLAVCTQPSSTLLRDRSRTVRRYATRTVTLTSRHIQATPCNTYFERGRWCHDAFYSTSSCCGSAASWSVRVSRHLLCTTSTHLDRIADTKTRAISCIESIFRHVSDHPPWHLADLMHAPRYVNVIVRQTRFSARMAGHPSLAG